MPWNFESNFEYQLNDRNSRKFNKMAQVSRGCSIEKTSIFKIIGFNHDKMFSNFESNFKYYD